MFGNEYEQERQHKHGKRQLQKWKAFYPAWIGCNLSDIPGGNHFANVPANLPQRHCVRQKRMHLKPNCVCLYVDCLSVFWCLFLWYLGNLRRLHQLKVGQFWATETWMTQTNHLQAARAELCALVSVQDWMKRSCGSFWICLGQG